MAILVKPLLRYTSRSLCDGRPTADAERDIRPVNSQKRNRSKLTSEGRTSLGVLPN